MIAPRQPERDGSHNQVYTDMKDSRVCIFGEVLFDHFPDGRRVLGGAPFNVAWHLQAFGLAPRFISRVGADAEGEAVLEAMRGWGMDTRAMQADEQLSTGRVSVAIVDDEPAYDIVPDCAYDAIEFRPDDVPAGSFVYHGTLAIRSAVSRRTLDAIMRDTAPAGVFLDVNLRPPWWDRESVTARINASDWVKLNHDELEQLGADTAADLLATHQLQGLIVTMGAEGAQAWTAGGEHFMVRPGASVGIVDTVGAGDAFTAVTILGIVRGWPLPDTLERAQAFASQIVGQRGATVSDRAFYSPLIEAWDLGTSTDT